MGNQDQNNYNNNYNRNSNYNNNWSSNMNNNYNNNSMDSNNNQQWRQQDRRFKVACCAIHNKQARNCRLQEKYANTWGDFMTWWVPERHIITGVYSEYNSAISDRRWRFIVCEI